MQWLRRQNQQLRHGHCPVSAAQAGFAEALADDAFELGEHDDVQGCSIHVVQLGTMRIQMPASRKASRAAGAVLQAEEGGARGLCALSTGARARAQGSLHGAGHQVAPSRIHDEHGQVLRRGGREGATKRLR